VSKEKFLLYAVGDVGPRRYDPGYPWTDPIFGLAAPTLKQADATFCQLERILTTKVTADYYDDVVHPDNVKCLLEGGFNVVSMAGNHHMDAGVDAFIDTFETLKKNGIKPVGVGMNIKEARTPQIVDKKGVKVGFLGYSSVIPKSEVPYDAEAHRPGCAPMYISTFYEASDWQPGTPMPRVISTAEKVDLEAMKEDVKRAKQTCDIVAVSFHWGVHHVPGLIAQYQFEVGHAAIDAGADVILGHHAHILKGLEVYKGKVIFFSLANFAMDSQLVKGISARWDTSLKPKEDHAEEGPFRQSGDKKKSIMVKVTISDKKIEKVAFQPILINKLGQPEFLTASDKRSDEVINYVKWCCDDQKLTPKFTRQGDDVVVTG
jgi:poly-gamma-glutamate capsule biosynthesis protein CapA/YwtB (metallophosphatase superfamily)